MITKTDERTRAEHEPEQLEPAHPQEDAGPQRQGEDRHGREPQRPATGAGIGWPSPGKMRERNAAANGERARGRPSCGRRIAGRILGPPSSQPPRRTMRSRRPTRAPEADVPTRQFEARPRRPGARDPGLSGRSAAHSPGCALRTRAARAGASSTAPSRPTTRWASTTPGAAPTRTCSSASTRCSARTSATRTASTARACGSRSTSSASSASRRKRDIEAYGIAEFVTPLQAARADLRGAPDRAVGPAGNVDGLERPGRAAPPARPARRRPAGRSPRSRARTAPSPTRSRCSSAGSACPRSAAPTSRSATRTTT